MFTNGFNSFQTVPTTLSLSAEGMPSSSEMPVVKSEPVIPESAVAMPINAPFPFSPEAFQINNSALQAILACGDNASAVIAAFLAIAKTNQTATAPVNVNQTISQSNSPVPEPIKRCRQKVFSNGFFMTFDKVSSCKTKHFWRCEYKNTCKARMHTDTDNKQIGSFIHDHNHEAPTPEEVRLYGLDPLNIERNRVYVVHAVSDPSQRRRIRKQVAEQAAVVKREEEHQTEATKNHQLAATLAVVQEVYKKAMSNSAQMAPISTAMATGGQLPCTSTEMFNPQQMIQQALMQSAMLNNTQVLAKSPSNISPNFSVSTESTIDVINDEPSTSKPITLKRPSVDYFNEDSDITDHPLFEPTFQIAHKLRKLWGSRPSRLPRTDDEPSTHLDFYISNFDGSEEHFYIPMRIEQRDEGHLKNALQEFSGQQLVGMLLFEVSSKISVVCNQSMLASWENSQFFLLDSSNPSRWRLIYVDDRVM